MCISAALCVCRAVRPCKAPCSFNGKSIDQRSFRRSGGLSRGHFLGDKKRGRQHDASAHKLDRNGMSTSYYKIIFCLHRAAVPDRRKWLPSDLSAMC